MSASGSRPTLSNLPLDLLHDTLLPILPIRDILALAQTSKAFSSLISSDLFWRRKLLYDLHFPVDRTARTTGFKDLYRRLTKPEVYTWGQNRNGRLGIPPDDPRIAPDAPHVIGDGVEKPLRVHGEGPDVKGFVDIQAGGWSFHALDREGKVWVWGTLNGEGWAGQHAGFENSSKTVPIPTRLPLSDALPAIAQLSCGRAHAVALSSGPSPQVYEWHAWGQICLLSTPSSPWSTVSPPQKPKSVVAGWSFTALLGDDGGVWCWWKVGRSELSRAQVNAGWEIGGRGNGEARVLALDPSSRSVRCPDLPRARDTIRARSKEVAGPKIVKLAAGDDFLIALASNSKVYRLDVSPVVPTGHDPMMGSLTHNDDVAQSEDDLQRSASARARLEAAFFNGRREWELLEKFCDMVEVAKLPAFNPTETAEPSASTSSTEKTTQTSAPAKPPSPSAKITHVSAKYESFAVYSVTGRDEDSLVLLGSKHSVDPDVVPELQGKGVIDVCLGDYHRGVLLASGQLLTWGQWSAGALGLAADDSDDSTTGQQSPPPYRGFFARRGLAFRHGPVIRPWQAPNQGSAVAKPTPVPMFAGAGPETEGNAKTKGEGKRRFVFSASFAGWHSGCLAVTLNEGDEHEARAHGESPEQASQENAHGLPEGIGDPPPYRIGGAGASGRTGSMPGSLDHGDDDD